MRTNNYYAALKALMYCSEKTDITAIDYAGTQRTLYNYDGHSSFVEGSLSSAIFPTSMPGAVSHIMCANNTVLDTKSYGIRFGTGTTEPSVNDYNLSGTLITGISILSTSSKEVTFTDNGAVVVTTYDVKNTSGAELTIGEIGLFARMSYNGSSYTSSFLIDRTLLDEPVVIPADGFAQIKYTLSYTF
jgi:hypothetical protein